MVDVALADAKAQLEVSRAVGLERALRPVLCRQLGRIGRITLRRARLVDERGVGGRRAAIVVTRGNAWREVRDLPLASRKTGARIRTVRCARGWQDFAFALAPAVRNLARPHARRDAVLACSEAALAA